MGQDMGLGQSAIRMTTQLKIIDTERFSKHLRSRGVDLCQKRVLVTKFSGSLQERDFTMPTNCDGFGRIHHFRRSQPRPWPANPLPIDPALHYLGLEAANEIEVQVFQSAICSWRCWYCFVDFALLSGNRRFSEFKTAEELIELYLKEEQRPIVIDLSGGQPDLVPEWTLWFLQAMERYGLRDSVYVWSDDNLSNDYLWRYSTAEDIRYMRSAENYGRVGCFKGFDPTSFAFNTAADPELFKQQFSLMRRLVESGFDVYGYSTFTSQSSPDVRRKMRDFVDRLQTEVHPIFPLRTVPLRIQSFSPTASRIGESEECALKVQEDAIEAWNDEIASRFTVEQRNRSIVDNVLT
jgi:uncharacterized Fe-S cluster-containing radical SAM superfamily protein